MKELTLKQKSILQFIELYIEQRSSSPTYREIAEEFSVSSKAAHDHVKAIEKKGKLKINTNKSRSIELVEKKRRKKVQESGIPLLGVVAAGEPLFAEENIFETLPINKSFYGTGEIYALTVEGDSMINAGISDGDIAIIKKQSTANRGDIVVASTGEGAITLKRYFLERDYIRLEPENDSYSPIRSKKITIMGILKGILRSY